MEDPVTWTQTETIGTVGPLICCATEPVRGDGEGGKMGPSSFLTHREPHLEVLLVEGTLRGATRTRASRSGRAAPAPVTSAPTQPLLCCEGCVVTGLENPENLEPDRETGSRATRHETLDEEAPKKRLEG